MQGRAFLFSVLAEINVGNPKRYENMMMKDLALERDRKKDTFYTGQLNHRAVNHLKQDW